MKRLSRNGFTLIELLVVIAIIMILAGMVFVVGPRMIERAKLASWTQTCNEIRTTLVAQYTKKAVGVGTFPAMYGYLKASVDHTRESEIGQPDSTSTDKGVHDERFFCMVPYISTIGYMREYGVYDPFGKDTYDTDRDGTLGLLEFSLAGIMTDAATKSYGFTEVARTVIFDGTNQAEEVSNQLHGNTDQHVSPQRPMVYLPVNLAQAKLVAEYYSLLISDKNEPLAGANATRWDPEETFSNNTVNPLTKLTFPPSRYDDFILISVGPGQDTGGILVPVRVANGTYQNYTSEFLAKVNRFDYYHVMALRAYYLATRDLNANDTLDFDYRNRTRGIEARPESYTNPNFSLLPNGTNGYGPLIYMPNKTISNLKNK